MKIAFVFIISHFGPFFFLYIYIFLALVDVSFSSQFLVVKAEITKSTLRGFSPICCRRILLKGARKKCRRLRANRRTLFFRIP